MSIHKYTEDVKHEIRKLEIEYLIKTEVAENYYRMGGYEHARILLGIQRRNDFNIPFNLIQIYSNVILMDKWKSASDELMDYIVEDGSFKRMVNWMIRGFNKIMSGWFSARAIYYGEIAESLIDKNSFLYGKYCMLRDYNLYVSNHYECQVNVGKRDRVK